MLSKIDTQDETYQFFVQESLELLQRLEEGLLNLQQEHNTKKIHSLMRAAHSIKGGAGCVGLSGIQTLAHHLENSFRALYREDIEFDRQLEDLLLQAYDTLRSPLIAQINTGKCSTDKAIEKIEEISAQLEAKVGHSLDEEMPFPEVEMDVDITQFLFREEIAQGLNRWEALLNNLQTPKLVEELKSQAEVFVSLGELLNLASFMEIAKITISALQINPGQAKAIGKVALTDFRAVQTAVLNGKILTEVRISEELAKLAQPKSKSSKKRRLTPKAATSSLLEDLEESSRQLYPKSPASSLLEDLEKTSKKLAPKSELSLFDALEIAESKEAVKTKITSASTSVKRVSPTGSPPAQKKVTKSQFREENKKGVNDNQFGQKEIITRSDSPLKKQEITQITAPFSDLKPSGEMEKKEDENLKVGVRVDVEKLDLMNNLVAELVTQENSFLLQHQQNREILDSIALRLTRFNKLSRTFQIQNLKSKLQNWETVTEEIAQLQEALQDIALTHQQVQQIIKKRQQTLKYLQNNLLQARMLPLGDLLKQFPRMVRDFAVKNNKEVNLQLVGMSTWVDKAILQKLYDPLIQLVRNAFDHGIETPEVRQAQGKSAVGNITIRAYHRGNNTYIEVQDDGEGIVREKMVKRIVDLNWLSASQAEALPKNSLYEYLFAPGFSTAKKVSELSGRGMGLQSVQLQISALKGSIGVVSEPGKGTIFTLRLPFSLTITRVLVFSIKNNLMAIPVDTLVAIAAAFEAEIETDKGEQFYRWQGQLIPICPYSLLSSYNYPWKPPIAEQRNSSYLWQETGKLPLLLISGGHQIIALKIDQILMEQDLAIEPFSEAMTPPNYLYGCTILGDGRLIPTLDGPQLAAWYQQKKAIPANSISPFLRDRKSVFSPMATILVVDDSLTMRKSLSLTLGKAGYQVIQAKNGWEAMEQLRQSPEIKAVISDIEMPQMNGFEFLGRCRKEFSDRTLPVIMLTSRSSEKYRLLAKKLGVSAYLTKPYLDKQLLSTLQQFL